MAEPCLMDGVTYHRCLPGSIDSVSGLGMKWSAARGQKRIKSSTDFAEKPLWRRALHFVLKPLRPGWSWIEERILF